MSIASSTARSLAAAVVALLLAAVGLMLSAGSAGAAPNGYVSGWLPFWRMSEAYSTTLANRDVFRTANPFWYSTRADGSVHPQTAGAKAGDAGIVRGLRSAGIRVVPTVTDPGLPATTAAKVMSDSGWRARHVAALSDLVQRHSYDGIDLDYETMGATAASSGERAAARKGYVALVQNLCTRMHSMNKTCSVTVMPKLADGTGVYDYAALGAAVDRFRVMAYDEHWSTSAPGPIASLPWVTKVVRYTLTRVPASKFELGVATYGRDWGAGTSKAVSGTDAPGLAAANKAKVRWDSTAREPYFTYKDAGGAGHTVYYSNAQSIKERVPLARRNGLAGVALWTVSGTANDAWAAIRSAVASAPASASAVPAYSGLIRYGSRGSSVAAVQRALRIPADGIFGPQTLGAVRSFQSSRGLAADGIVGPRTWAVIFGSSSAAAAPARTPAPAATPPSSSGVGSYPGSLIRYGSRGSSVAAVQRALRIPADGIFGPQTLGAVRSFQSSRGLAADGIVGPRTWAALR